MISSFNFNDLFVFEMANNHQGDKDHGKAIIRAIGDLTKKYGIRGAVKFQFRQLDTFIHKNHQHETSNKHIPRFLSTRLTRDQFVVLTDEVRKAGMIPMSTPFDEESVDMIEEMNLDIIKVGSCSAKDWPLLEKIAEASKPVIFSTGGLTIKEIDNLVSFFDHRGVEYAIMHCVSIYPIPDEKFNLSQIEMLRSRYPGKTIGFSTHEAPDEFAAVQIAVAKGARMFERHIGIATDKIQLNSYSSSPEQTERWIQAYLRANMLCGVFHREEPSVVEAESLRSLQRGVYLRTDIKKGAVIDRTKVYFAMPIQEGQVPSGEWKVGCVAKESLKADAGLMLSEVQFPPTPKRVYIQEAVHQVKALLNEARVQLSSEFKVEYSHHYGMEKFSQVGCVLIECINREYCKKIVVQLAGQAHPLHYHRRKEETFQVLYGVMHVEIDGHRKTLHAGDTLLVLPGVWHRFWTDKGCVAEEVSTTHYNNDSVYQDKRINQLTRQERKTTVDHWGRFQIGRDEIPETPVKPSVSSAEITQDAPHHDQSSLI